jgi:hypothetical protein
LHTELFGYIFAFVPPNAKEIQMNSYPALCAASLLMLFGFSGCGGGGFDPQKVTVAVSPASDTIPVGGTLALTATIKGLCSTCAPAINEWTVTENNGGTCNWFDTPPIEPCPGGTIEETTGGGFLTVTYHAPATSGTYHIVAEWCICFGSSITQDGTAVVTVSP